MIPAEWNLSPELVNRVGTKFGRQRMIHEDEQLLLVLHYRPELDSSNRHILLLWKESMKSKWRASSSNSERAASIDTLIEEYDTRIENLDDRFDEGVSLKEHFSILEELNPVLRAIRNIAAVFDAALQVCPKDSVLVEYGEKAHSISRVADLLAMSVKNNLEFLQASQLEVDNQLNHRVATAAHKLNLIVAIFLPLTAITSLFGMNLASGLDDSDPQYFLAVLFLGLGFGLVLSLFIGRFPALPALKSIPRKLLISSVKDLPLMRSSKEVNPKKK